MNWTKNEQRMLEWAEEHAENPADASSATYWHKRENEGSGVIEYGFETFAEIQKYLEAETMEKEFSVIMSTAAIQGKMQYYRESEMGEVQMAPDVDIKDFVYMF